MQPDAAAITPQTRPQHQLEAAVVTLVALHNSTLVQAGTVQFIFPDGPGEFSCIYLEYFTLFSNSGAGATLWRKFHFRTVGLKLHIGMTTSDRLESDVLPCCFNLHPAAWVHPGFIETELFWLQLPAPVGQPAVQRLPCGVLQHNVAPSEIRPCHGDLCHGDLWGLTVHMVRSCRFTASSRVLQGNNVLLNALE